MLIKRPDDIKPSEITDPKLYFSRRRFLRTSTGAMVVATVPGLIWPSPTLAAR
ncbi:MAG: twin-arginine translocation signal domain-containing protein, partial [Gammaproteobacteria bacterium]